MSENKKLSQIKTSQDRVQKLLENSLEQRDDDYKLTANFWFYELRDLGLDPKQITAFTLLGLYAGKKLTQADVITRARRKIQENNPHLRGEKWEERQKSAAEIKKEI